MEQQEYDELVRRLVAVSEQHEKTLAGVSSTLRHLEERQDDRQADMHSLLGSLDTKYQRMDVSLTYLDEAMGKQTTILAQQQTLQDEQKTLLAEQKTLLEHHTTLLDRITLVLERHEATFERLGRLLDERLPPAGNGR